MNYFEYDFQTTGTEQSEILMAFLSEYPFDTFDEYENGLKAYIKEEDLDEALKTEIEAVASPFSTAIAAKLIPYKNWNAEWESQFEPILIDQFVAIRAEFHPQFPDFEHQITIQPKMAFGTGHHETTYMMMQLMEHIDFNGTKVLDYGCGTGILAVLASQRGAAHIDAVDIEFPSYENTIEHCTINEVTNVQTFHGTLDDIKDADYDVILANINILEEDETLITESIQSNDFEIIEIKRRGYWLAIKCK